MDVYKRKKKAEQARTQVTISIAMRFALTIGAVLAALAAAVSAFAGFDRADRVASAIVVFLLILEVVVYGIGHLSELIKTRNFYSSVINEIEDNQYVPKKEPLQMPRSYPHNETVAVWVNNLRWRKKSHPVVAGLLVALYVVIYILIVLAIVCCLAWATDHFLVNFELVHLRFPENRGN